MLNYLAVNMRIFLISAGLIQAGDEVREVNGIKVVNKCPDEFIRLIVGKICALDDGCCQLNPARFTS